MIPAPDHQRHREHRAVARLLDQRAGLRGENDARVGQNIGRRDRATLGHREAGEHLISWNPVPRGKRAVLAGGRDHHQAIRHVIELPQDGHGPAEQSQDRLGDVPAHALGIERLHERLAHRRERRRVAPGRSLASEDVRLIALDRAPLGEIAEDEHHAHRVAGAVADGIRPARDAALVAAPAHEQDTGGQRRHLVVAEHARGQALAGARVSSSTTPKTICECAAAGLGGRPPGEMLRRRVHERDPLGPIRHDDRVADARERDRHFFALSARVVLGPAAPGGQHADGARHQREDRGDGRGRHPAPG